MAFYKLVPVMIKRPLRKILFITWDGPDTRYLERLFLPIFSGLQERGYRLHVLQFTWNAQDVSDQRSALCQDFGIPYRHVTILRRFGAAGPLLSALFGVTAIRRAVSDWDIDTLMPRSLMPALAVLRLSRAEQSALNIIFDADGLAVDERVDFSGLSPHGMTYRILRDVEAEFLRRSSIVLTRTESAKAVLLARAGSALAPSACHVVPNGVDPLPFQKALAGLSKDSLEEFSLVYCGSIGAQYRMPEMLQIALRLRAVIPTMRFRVFTPSVNQVAGVLQEMGMGNANWIEVGPVYAQSVPAKLAQCDVGIALRARSFSTQAVLPIKLGEYLLAGLPIIGTPGVGNTEELEAAGVFRSAEASELDQTVQWILEDVLPGREAMRRRSHQVGMQVFSLEATVKRYAAALEACGSDGTPAGVTSCVV